LAAPKDNSEKTKEISRSHKIIISNSDLITITGGKWTTFRRMAQDTVNKAIIVGKLPKERSKTKNFPIHGALETTDRTDHLYLYGSDQIAIRQLLLESPELDELLHPNAPFSKVEVVWAIRNEMARTVEDILARRLRMLFLDARAAIETAPLVAKLLAKELGKDAVWEQKQVQDFTAIAKNYIL
jgi:glycerol-3-phosphate dehydrogenase